MKVRDTPDKYVDSWIKVAHFVDDVGYRPYRWFAPAREMKASLEHEYKYETTGNHPEGYLDRAVLRQACKEALDACPGRSSPPATTHHSGASGVGSLSRRVVLSWTVSLPAASRAFSPRADVNYNAKVAAELPSEQLLVFNVKQGWAPLCKHLGVPVPEGVPFPHVHNGAKVMGESHVIVLVTWIWPLAILLPGFCVWKLLDRRWRRMALRGIAAVGASPRKAR